MYKNVLKHLDTFQKRAKGNILKGWIRSMRGWETLSNS